MGCPFSTASRPTLTNAAYPSERATCWESCSGSVHGTNAEGSVRLRSRLDLIAAVAGRPHNDGRRVGDAGEVQDGRRGGIKGGEERRRAAGAGLRPCSRCQRGTGRRPTIRRRRTRGGDSSGLSVLSVYILRLWYTWLAAESRLSTIVGITGRRTTAPAREPR